MMPAAYALKPSVTVILPRLPVASMSFIFSAFSNGTKIPALEYVNANDSRALYQQPISCCSFKCQRSSQCPMCWQPISLKDPTSQELLEAVERERNFRINPPRNATIFHHPTLGDFELQHLPVGASDADLEERIIQHLAAAAAMGRARHIARREGQRNRSSAQGRPHFLVFSTHPNSPPMAPTSSSPSQRGDDEATPTIAVANLSPSPATGEQSSQLTLVAPVQEEQVSASGSGSSALGTEHQGSSYNNRRSPNQSSPSSQDRAGPSELQSFSESLKSKLNAVSSRYKESISKSTRGWKERWFSRNNAMSDIGSDVRREVNAGIATVSRMMERLETRDSNRSNINSAPSNLEDDSVQGPNDQALTGTEGGGLLGDNNTKASCAAGSSSS
ncbi:E3 ubiquitin-protein ligase RHF2A isoform X2 [Vigna radiata var. radiata]|uniref:E3 ubiquitin-protein ligase RHF2A isoform X2 n=1 Tax=Vigna radiata var. radiata TaxID=3916 RepID=A0A3Q0EPT7_VIGRR|nr:E3 ubiquitin-protein ligase RHF2A isoform X2 [Vigna radiata var. radiata]